MRTSSLLRIGLQDPLDDVVAAQAPDCVVVDGVHAGAQGLLLQLCHPTSNQPASHTQQQQQQQLQLSTAANPFDVSLPSGKSISVLPANSTDNVPAVIFLPLCWFFRSGSPAPQLTSVVYNCKIQ